MWFLLTYWLIYTIRYILWHKNIHTHTHIHSTHPLLSRINGNQEKRTTRTTRTTGTQLRWKSERINEYMRIIMTQIFWLLRGKNIWKWNSIKRIRKHETWIWNIRKWNLYSNFFSLCGLAYTNKFKFESLLSTSSQIIYLRFCIAHSLLFGAFFIWHNNILYYIFFLLPANDFFFSHSTA